MTERFRVFRYLDGAKRVYAERDDRESAERIALNIAENRRGSATIIVEPFFDTKRTPPCPTTR